MANLIVMCSVCPRAKLKWKPATCCTWWLSSKSRRTIQWADCSKWTQPNCTHNRGRQNGGATARSRRYWIYGCAWHWHSFGRSYWSWCTWECLGQCWRHSCAWKCESLLRAHWGSCWLDWWAMSFLRMMSTISWQRWHIMFMQFPTLSFMQDFITRKCQTWYLAVLQVKLLKNSLSLKWVFMFVNYSSGEHWPVQVALKCRHLSIKTSIIFIEIDLQSVPRIAVDRPHFSSA